MIHENWRFYLAKQNQARKADSNGQFRFEIQGNI